MSAAAAWWSEPAERLLERLGSRPAGLGAAEAAARLRAHGPNALRPRARLAALRLLLRQFESPLVARVTGREAVLEALRSMLPAVLGVTIRDHIADGEFVATRFDLTTPFGEIEVFDRFRVVNGLLAEIRPFYDPRPITSAMAANSA